MLKFEELTEIRNKMSATVSAMQARLDMLNASIEKVSADKSRSAAWIADEVAKLRDAATPFFSKSLEKLRADAVVIQAQEPCWESKSFLLSQARFSENDVSDATIRTAHGMECSRMNTGLLELMGKAAQAEGNLPLLFQVYLAKAEFVDFATLDIPEQADALKAIRECLSFPAKGEIYFSMASNSALSAMRKMQLGRAAMV